MRQANDDNIGQHRQTKRAKAVRIEKNTKNLKTCISPVLQSTYQIPSEVDIFSKCLSLLPLVNNIIDNNCGVSDSFTVNVRRDINTEESLKHNRKQQKKIETCRKCQQLGHKSTNKYYSVTSSCTGQVDKETKLISRPGR